MADMNPTKDQFVPVFDDADNLGYWTDEASQMMTAAPTDWRGELFSGPPSAAMQPPPLVPPSPSIGPPLLPNWPLPPDGHNKTTATLQFNPPFRYPQVFAPPIIPPPPNIIPGTTAKRTHRLPMSLRGRLPTTYWTWLISRDAPEPPPPQDKKGGFWARIAAMEKKKT